MEGSSTPEPKPNRCRYLVEDVEHDKRCPNPAREGKNLCDNHMDSSQGDLEVFRAVTDHFKQDIREFFTRSSFYLVAEGGLLAIFFAKVTKTMPTTTFEYILNVSVILTGLGLAIFWLFVSSGAVKWIDRWRDEIIRVDKIISQIHSYFNVESGPCRPRSPEKVTGHLPWLFIGIWAIVFVFIILKWTAVIC